MKHRSFFGILASIALFAAAQASIAAEYTVDKDHSNVGFKIRHLVSKTSGEFKDFEGHFTFDDKKPATSSVTFAVKTKSINTNNDKRDEHLRSGDFFDTEKFPEMKFVSKSVKAGGNKKYKVSGDLTIRDVTKPVTFDVEYGGEVKDPWGNTKAGFSAHAMIKRKDFGLTWNKTLDAGGVVLGDEVEIDIAVEGQKK